MTITAPNFRKVRFAGHLFVKSATDTMSHKNTWANRHTDRQTDRQKCLPNMTFSFSFRKNVKKQNVLDRSHEAFIPNKMTYSHTNLTFLIL